MPWAKYPETDVWVKVRHSWSEPAPNFPNGKLFVDFDDDNPKVHVRDMRNDPKFNAGDKVYCVLPGPESKPDPTRMDGIVDAIFFKSDGSGGFCAYDVIWPIHSLVATENHHKDQHVEGHLTLMDSEPRISAPRFKVGEMVNIQGQVTVLRQNKVLGYSNWEAPPEGNWAKGDRGWWVDVEFSTGAGQAAERKLWNQKHAPFDKQTIRDNPHGLTIIQGADEDSIFIISNEDWEQGDAPIYQGKISEGLDVDALRITDYDKKMIGRMGSQQPLSSTGGLAGHNTQTNVAPAGGWKNIFSGRRELAPDQLGYRDDGRMFELDPFEDMVDEPGGWRPGDTRIELGAIEDLGPAGVEPVGTVPVETGPGADLPVIEPQVPVTQVDPAPTGATPERIRRIGMRFRGRGNPEPKWNDPEDPFRVGREFVDDERTGLLDGQEAANLTEVELQALREGVAAEIGEGGALALEEGIQIGAVAAGTGSFFLGISAGAWAGGLVGIAALLVVGGIILIASLTHNAPPGTVPSVDGGRYISPVLTKFNNELSGKLVWVFCHIPGDPVLDPKWWRGVVTGYQSNYQASDPENTFHLTVLTTIYLNNTEEANVKVTNMLNLIEQTQGPPPMMRKNSYMFDKETSLGLEEFERTWDKYDNYVGDLVPHFGGGHAVDPMLMEHPEPKYVEGDYVKLVDDDSTFRILRSNSERGEVHYDAWNMDWQSNEVGILESRISKKVGSDQVGETDDAAERSYKDTDNLDLYRFKLVMPTTSLKLSTNSIVFTHPSKVMNLCFDYDKKTVYLVFKGDPKKMYQEFARRRLGDSVSAGLLNNMHDIPEPPSDKLGYWDQTQWYISQAWNEMAKIPGLMQEHPFITTTLIVGFLYHVVSPRLTLQAALANAPLVSGNTVSVSRSMGVQLTNAIANAIWVCWNIPWVSPPEEFYRNIDNTVNMPDQLATQWFNNMIYKDEDMQADIDAEWEQPPEWLSEYQILISPAWGMDQPYVKQGWSIPILPNIIPAVLGWDTIDDLIDRGHSAIDVYFWQQTYRANLMRYVNTGVVGAFASAELILYRYYGTCITFHTWAMLQSLMSTSYRGFLTLFHSGMDMAKRAQGTMQDEQTQFMVRQFLQGMTKKGATTMVNVHKFLFESFDNIEQDLNDHGEYPSETDLAWIHMARDSMKNFIPWFSETMQGAVDLFTPQNLNLFDLSFETSFGGMFQDFESSMDRVVERALGHVGGQVDTIKNAITQSAQAGAAVALVGFIAYYMLSQR